MSEVEITQMRIQRKPFRLSDDKYLLAHFGCRFRGMSFGGCRLVYMATSDALLTMLPTVKKRSDDTMTKIRIEDNNLWHDLQQRAVAVFESMGGEVPVVDKPKNAGEALAEEAA